MLKLNVPSKDSLIYYDKCFLDAEVYSSSQITKLKKELLTNAFSEKERLYLACIEYDDAFYTSFQRTLGWILKAHNIYLGATNPEKSELYSIKRFTFSSGANKIRNVPLVSINPYKTSEYYVTNTVIRNIEEIIKVMYVNSVNEYDYLDFPHSLEIDKELKALTRRFRSSAKVEFKDNLYFPNSLEDDFRILSEEEIENYIFQLNYGAILNSITLRDIALNLIRLLSELGFKKHPLSEVYFKIFPSMEKDLFKYEGYNFMLPHTSDAYIRFVPFEAIEKVQNSTFAMLKNGVKGKKFYYNI